jgi:hypothetical protein
VFADLEMSLALIARVQNPYTCHTRQKHESILIERPKLISSLHYDQITMCIHSHIGDSLKQLCGIHKSRMPSCRQRQQNDTTHTHIHTQSKRTKGSEILTIFANDIHKVNRKANQTIRKGISQIFITAPLEHDHVIQMQKKRFNFKVVNRRSLLAIPYGVHLEQSIVNGRL